MEFKQRYELRNDETGAQDGGIVQGQGWGEQAELVENGIVHVRNRIGNIRS